MSFWLLKSEPSAFSIDDLDRAPKKTTFWDGVRNYQARNFMRDGMKKGDLAFFYHSNAEPPAVMGTVEIVREAYPDPTQFDRKHVHYDAKASPGNPPWVVVDVRLANKFKSPVALDVLKRTAGLEGMEILRRGSRLSVTPVTPAEWNIIIGLAKG